MFGRHIGRIVLIMGTGLVLAGCEAGKNPFARAPSDSGEAAVAAPARSTERDVEKPDVFSATDQGLWDGRPSLGGVWVAHADVKDPERVMIRNAATGKSVIGALFRRERDNPGPKLQVSSDAAEALGMLAGQPVSLSVVALRREAVPEPVAAAADPAAETPPGAPETITATPLAGAAAPDAKTPAKATAPAAAAAPPVAAAAAPKGGSGRAFVQIGIFSVEANAKRAADQIRAAGPAAEVRKEESQGKTFWRVVAGPAGSAAEREALVKKIKGLGYADAYAVSN